MMSSYLAGEIFFGVLLDLGRWRTQQIPNAAFYGESIAWHLGCSLEALLGGLLSDHPL